MAMIRCPICGERYSDTYKYCPFCEEEEALEDGEEIRRYPQGGHRGGRQPNLITPTLIVLIIIMAALLVYLLWGDKIADKFKKDDEPDNPQVEDPVIKPEEPTPGVNSNNPPADPDNTDLPENPSAPSTPDGTMPETPDGGQSSQGYVPSGSGNSGSSGNPGGSSGSSGNSGSSGGQMSYQTAAALPSGLSLNKTDFTRPVKEGNYTLKVSGGSGTYTWISDNPNVASVDSSGVVTPVSAGTAHIVVTDGSRQATCIVRVTGKAASSSGSSSTTSTPSGGNSGSGGSYSLNKTDFTRSTSEGSYQLKVSGVTTAVSWSTSNAAVATVDGNGNVTPVGKGQATITASWDGQSLKCIIRVPG